MVGNEDQNYFLESSEPLFQTLVGPEQIERLEHIQDWVQSNGTLVQVRDPAYPSGYRQDRGRKWNIDGQTYEVTYNLRNRETTLVRAEINPDDMAVSNGEKLRFNESYSGPMAMTKVSWESTDDAKRRLSAADSHPRDFTAERTMVLLQEFELAIHKSSRIKRIAQRAGKAVSYNRPKAK